jgi:hypothetical protein
MYFFDAIWAKQCLLDPRDIGVVLKAWPLCSLTFKQLHLNINFLTWFGLNEWLLNLRDIDVIFGAWPLCSPIFEQFLFYFIF